MKNKNQFLSGVNKRRWSSNVGINYPKNGGTTRYRGTKRKIEEKEMNQNKKQKDKESEINNKFGNRKNRNK